jgi:hypothetical protein
MARALLKSRFCEIEGGLSEKLFEHRRSRGEFFSRRRRFQAKSLDFNTALDFFVFFASRQKENFIHKSLKFRF